MKSISCEKQKPQSMKIEIDIYNKNRLANNHVFFSACVRALNGLT